MKKLILSMAAAIVATSGAMAQTVTDVQNATLNTTIPRLIALRPYTGFASAANGQSLTATVTGTEAVMNGNSFNYTGNNGYNGLAYRIYSNTTYSVSLQAEPTAGSNDQLNNYINFYAETLPSPQNGTAPYAANNNGDHLIDIPSNQAMRLSSATGTPQTILHNDGYNTGKWLPPGLPYSPLDPVNTDFAAFGVKFAVSPGFAVFPGTFTTNLVVTATSL